MAEFQTFDLGRVIQTAEAIKGLRRQSATDALSEQYMGEQIQNMRSNRERQAKQDEVVFGKEKAQHVYTQMQYVLRAPNPKNFVEQNFPDLVSNLQKNGVQWETLDDEGVKRMAQGLAAKSGAEAGIAPPAQVETIGDVNNPSGGVLQRDPATGALKQVVAPQKPDLGQAQLDETTRHNKAMEQKQPAGFGALTDTTQADTLAQMIATGAMPMPTGRALLTPLGQYLTQKVSELNPNFTGTTYPTVAAAFKAFTSGQESRKVRSLNTAIAHMGTLDELSVALNNKDTQAFNRVANFLSKETGGTAVTNFNTAKELVAKEVITAVVAGGGGQAEREEAANSFNAVSSPAQLAEVTNVYRELLGGQLHSLRQQYEQGTNRKDFDRFLSPLTKKAIGNGQDAPPPANPAAQPPGTDIQSLLDKYAPQ